jgi:subtilisin family serine protease
VASVAGMGVNNGIGGAGVGNFSILPITIADSSGASIPSWAAKGIELAAASGARVINISFTEGDYAPLDQAAANARKMGALTFVCTGNDNLQKTFDSQFPNLIFVSGTDANDNRWVEGASGSNYGPFVDIAAPADNILAADPTLPNGYGVGDGTSFATALVSGAAALAWSIRPDLTPDQVEDILFSTAVDLGPHGWDEEFGYGRLNIGAVAAAAYAMPEPATLALLAAGLAVVAARRRAAGRPIRGRRGVS